MKHTIRYTSIAALLALMTSTAFASDSNSDDVERQIKRDNWFASLDLNNDGYISEEEFVQAQVRQAEERARQSFARLDEHNKGEISVEEFNTFIDQRFAHARERGAAFREQARVRRAELREADGEERAERPDRPRREERSERRQRRSGQ